MYKKQTYRQIITVTLLLSLLFLSFQTRPVTPLFLHSNSSDILAASDETLTDCETNFFDLNACTSEMLSRRVRTYETIAGRVSGQRGASRLLLEFICLSLFSISLENSIHKSLVSERQILSRDEQLMLYLHKSDGKKRI